MHPGIARAEARTETFGVGKGKDERGFGSKSSPVFSHGTGFLSRSQDVRSCILVSPVRALRTLRARCGSSARPLLLLAHGVLPMHRFVGHVHGRCGWNVCLGLTTRTSSHPLALHTLSVLVARPLTIPRRGRRTPPSPFLCGTPSAPGSAGPSAWTFLSDPGRSLSNASDSPFPSCFLQRGKGREPPVRARLVHRTTSAAAAAMPSAAAVSSRVARCAHVATAERRSAKVSTRR